MSLDVSLYAKASPCPTCGSLCPSCESNPDRREVEVYTANITHNLNRMAGEAGIYEALWRPEEINITQASQLVPILVAGLTKLVDNPEHYRQFNAPNNWGTYENFLPFVLEYLKACQKYPDASVRVSR